MTGKYVATSCTLPGVKLLAAVVVVCGLTLAGCGGSGGDSPTSPVASTTEALSEPTNLVGTVAAAPTKARGTNDPVVVDVVAACNGLITVADPASQLPVLTVIDLTARSALVSNYGQTPAVSATDLTTSLTALASAQHVGGPTLDTPVGQLGTAVLAIQDAVNYKTTVDPSISYTEVQEVIRQIKVTCGQAGVVGA